MINYEEMAELTENYNNMDISKRLTYNQWIIISKFISKATISLLKNLFFVTYDADEVTSPEIAYNYYCTLPDESMELINALLYKDGLEKILNKFATKKDHLL